MTEDLTLCITSCGEHTREDCVASLNGFKGKVVFQEVTNVFPQVVALNQMLIQCKTSFLIPIDADFILYPSAPDRIFAAINKHKDKNWHTILFLLYDELTENNILALKILNMKYMKSCMFEDSRTPDIKNYDKLQATGAICIHEYLKEEPIGKHVVKGDFFCYQKYKDVYQTMRSHKRIWDDGVVKGGKTIRRCALDHYNFFMRKYNETKNEEYKHCISGMLDGLTSELKHQSKSLEIRPNKIDIKDIDKQFMNWLINNKDPELINKLN